MQARWLRLTVRDSRTPTTRTQKLSRRLLRNDRGPCRASRRAAVTSLFIRTPIRSQTNRKFYAPASLLPENVVYRAPTPLIPTTPLKDNRNSGPQITPSCAHLGNAGSSLRDGAGGSLVRPWDVAR